MKIFKYLASVLGIFVVMLLVGAYSPSAKAATPVGCTQSLPYYNSGGGSPYFANLETYEYSGGYLVLHMKRNMPVDNSLDWRPNFIVVDDSCATYSFTNIGKLNFIDPSVQNISIRFTSPTAYAFWNDDTNTVLTCGACSGNVPFLLGDFFKIRLHNSVTYFGDFIGETTSTALNIKENPTLAPVLTATLPKPAPCTALSSSGSLIDSTYERAEYDGNNLLRIHFRHDPFQLGDFQVVLNQYDSGCVTKVVALNKTIFFDSFIKYFSIRFTDLTHYQIWNDDSNVPVTCINSCSGAFTAVTFNGLPATYTSFGGSNDSSSFTSTPFPLQQLDATPPVVVIAPPTEIDPEGNLPKGTLLKIDVTVTDTDGSGVATTVIKFDNVVVANGVTIDTSTLALGTHTISVTATDVAGNVTTTTFTFTLIANCASAIADVNKAYADGWITEEKTRKYIVRDITKACEWQAKHQDGSDDDDDKEDADNDDEDDDNDNDSPDAYKLRDQVIKKFNDVVKHLSKGHRLKNSNQAARDLITADINSIIANIK